MDPFNEMDQYVMLELFHLLRDNIQQGMLIGAEL